MIIFDEEKAANKNGRTGERTGSNRKIPFLITSSYFLSFLFIRIAVVIAGSVQSPASQAAKAGELRFYIGTNIILFGYHIHHLVIGIFLIALAGWFAIVGSQRLSRSELAIMYGVGMGLFMDEVGMLLSWGDYWSTTTYVLSLLLAGIFLNVIYFPDFWAEVRGQLKHTNPQHFISVRDTSRNFVIRGVDIVAEEASDTNKITGTFSGIIYIGVGLLVIAYPDLVYYWVAGGFLLQGISALVQTWKS